MSHRCDHCGKAFRKSAALRQHDQTVHVERPRQRRAEAQRVIFRSERQMAVGRGMVNRPPELLPFGGIGDFGILLETIREALATVSLDRVGPKALEPPTLDLVVEDRNGA